MAVRMPRASEAFLNTYTGSSSEIAFDTDRNRLRSFDGSTQGGTTYLSEEDVSTSSVFAYGASGDGSNQTSALQSALDAEEGSTLYFPEGDYLVTSALQVGEGTTLILAKDARIIRGANIDNVMRNKPGESFSIQGGTIDCNESSFGDKCVGIAVGHAEGVHIDNVRVVDVASDGHAVQVHASKNVFVQNCRFTFGGDDSMAAEAVRISAATGTIIFPWFTPNDDTGCENVWVTNCAIEDWAVGVGSYNSQTGEPHRHVYVNNNSMKVSRAGVRAVNWRHAHIQGNTIINEFDGTAETGPDCFGVWIDAADATCEQILIQNNSIDNFVWGSAEGRAIRVDGSEGVFRVNIIGNVLGDCSTHVLGVSNAEKCVISNNYMEGGGGAVSDTHSLFVYDSSEVTVSGNKSGGSYRFAEDGGSANGIVISGNTLFSFLDVSSGNNIFATGNFVGWELRGFSGSSQYATNNVVSGSLVENF